MILTFLLKFTFLILQFYFLQLGISLLDDLFGRFIFIEGLAILLSYIMGAAIVQSASSEFGERVYKEEDIYKDLFSHFTPNICVILFLFALASISILFSTLFMICVFYVAFIMINDLAVAVNRLFFTKRAIIINQVIVKIFLVSLISYVNPQTLIHFTSIVAIVYLGVGMLTISYSRAEIRNLWRVRSIALYKLPTKYTYYKLPGLRQINQRFEEVFFGAFVDPSILTTFKVSKQFGNLSGFVQQTLSPIISREWSFKRSLTKNISDSYNRLGRVSLFGAIAMTCIIVVFYYLFVKSGIISLSIFNYFELESYFIISFCLIIFAWIGPVGVFLTSIGKAESTNNLLILSLILKVIMFIIFLTADIMTSQVLALTFAIPLIIWTLVGRIIYFKN